MPWLPGKFVWFEHLSSDVDRARDFHGRLFGWKSDPVPVGDGSYPMIVHAGTPIGGFRVAPAGTPAHWISYLSVADVDACVEAASGAGARVLAPPADHGAIGRCATLADPAGAVFSVWRDSTGDREDTATVAAGDWCWNECMSTDPSAALAFYERVFGYTHSTMDLGPQGAYFTLSKDGVARAGLMRSAHPGAPSAWMPYVAVDDCDATLAQAIALGGSACVPSTDIPGVGRFAVLADPTGAMLGVIRLTQQAA